MNRYILFFLFMTSIGLIDVRAESLNISQNKNFKAKKQTTVDSSRLWVSSYKNIVHNSNCIYYNDKRGYFQKDSSEGGTDCKVCGGRIRKKVEITAPEQQKKHFKKKFWIDVPSGIIHNSNCKHFRNSNGFSSNYSSFGENCKICGGSGKKPQISNNGTVQAQTTKIHTKNISNSQIATPSKTSNNYSKEAYASQQRKIYTGPRGGQYYINKNGNKTYLRQSATQNRTVYTGPRGGRYYINKNGRKTYLSKKRRYR